jgi:pSer/pThr/pTyr-binding forkhead associated (FHA) protein
LPSLRFKVLQMPNLSQPIEKVLTDFPYVVGRAGADLTLTTDESISRRHLEISLRGGEFFITDLKSTYGTFIGEAQLEANKPTRLNGATVIRLGRRTHIRLEPQ